MCADYCRRQLPTSPAEPERIRAHPLYRDMDDGRPRRHGLDIARLQPLPALCERLRMREGARHGRPAETQQAMPDRMHVLAPDPQPGPLPEQVVHLLNDATEAVLDRQHGDG